MLIERRQAEAGQEAREAAKKAGEEMANWFSTQLIAWETKRTALLAQLKEVVQGKQEAEQQLAAVLQEKDSTKTARDQKKVECQEVTMMLKEVVEENSQIRVDLDVRTKQVHQLRRSRSTHSGTHPSV